jgi:hypothetical protein
MLVLEESMTGGEERGWRNVILGSEKPTGVAVCRVAAAVAEAWDRARSEFASARNDEEATFLEIAHEYLAERQAALHRQEARRLALVRRRRQDLISIDTRYGGAHEQSPFLEALATLLAVLVAVGLYSSAPILIWVGQSAGRVFEPMMHLVPEQMLVFILFFSLPMMLELTAGRISTQILEYVGMKWHGSFYAAHLNSTECFNMEIEQTRTMSNLPQSLTNSRPGIHDPDLAAARDRPVPIQPGITEFVFSTNYLTIDEIEYRFRLGLGQCSLHFRGTFVVFSVCLLAGLSALSYIFDLYAVGVIGFVCGITGVYCRRSFARLRIFENACTLFMYYASDLRKQICAANAVMNESERNGLRAEAWTKFRRALNELDALGAGPGLASSCEGRFGISRTRL